MRILRQLPFMVTVLFTVVTIVAATEIAVWPPDDAFNLYADIIADPSDPLVMVQVLVDDDIGMELLALEDVPPYYLVAGEGSTYNARIAWNVYWQRETIGFVELVGNVEVFRQDDETAWQGTDLRAVFVEQEGVGFVSDEYTERLALTEPGRYGVMVFVSAIIETEDGAFHEINREAYREVVVLPPVEHSDDIARHAPPIDVNNPVLLTADWWALQQHPCEIVAERGITDGAELCAEINREDAQATLEVAYTLLDWLNEEDNDDLTAMLLHQVGLLMLHTDNPDDAIEALMQAVELYAFTEDTAGLAAALHNMALALYLVEDNPEAERVGRHAVELRASAPDDGGVLYSALQLHVMKDDRDTARATAGILQSRGLPHAAQIIDWLDSDF
ncbi:MAG: tetratricopeptide repeat protein [Chloroflexota bacterium]